MKRPSLVIATLAGLVGLSACGQKNLGSKIAPPTQSGAEALGESLECTDVGTVTEPYVVDLSGTERSHLEAAMTEGVALVHYDCNGFEILKACEVVGAPQNSYEYVGISLKEEEVQIDSLDQVKANLPANAVKLQAELTAGSTIDIGMLMIGLRSTTYDSIGPTQLSGPDCSKATHFVRKAVVGAFAMDQGTKGKARAAADIFNASASAGSESNKSLTNRDGEPAACREAQLGGPLPEACRSAIKVLLYPVAEPGPEEATNAEATAGADPDDSAADAEPEALAVTCGRGLVRSGGKCAPPSQVKSFECKPGRQDECRAQCDAGNAGSCYNLAVLLRDRAAKAKLYERACSDPRGPAKACSAAARELWFGTDDKERVAQRYGELMVEACDRGDGSACASYGSAQVYGRNDQPKNVAEGLGRIERACGMGNRFACQNLATALVESGADPGRGIKMIDTLCEEGGRSECSAAARLYLWGKAPGGRDAKKALAYRRKACDLEAFHECRAAGDMLREGKGLKKNKRAAQAMYERGCTGVERTHGPPGAKARTINDAASCRELGRMLRAKSPRKAEAAFKRGCEPDQGWKMAACGDLGELYAKGAKGVRKDPAGAEALLRTACDKRDRNACLVLGAILEKKDKGIAKAFYEEQCSANNGHGDTCKAFARLGGTPPKASGPPGPPRPPGASTKRRPPKPPRKPTR